MNTNLGRFLSSVGVAVLLVVSSLLLGSDRAWACSCAAPPPSLSQQEITENALSGSAAVFSGRVVDIDSPSLRGVVSSGDPVKVRLMVSRVWKGPEQKTLTVTTARSGASCGYDFQRGREYLVYASEGMRAALCSETKPLSEAGADLEALGPGEVPKSSEGSGNVSPLPEPIGRVFGVIDPDWFPVAAAGVTALVLANFQRRRLEMTPTLDRGRRDHGRSVHDDLDPEDDE